MEHSNLIMFQRQHRHRPPSHSAANDVGKILIFGIHAVEAALSNPARQICQLYLTENARRRLETALLARAAKHQRVLPRDLDRRLGADTVHQGALLETAPLDEPTLAELVNRVSNRPIIVLDQVTDPHNVGAILRSAAVFGAAGLVMTRRHSPPLGGALAKTASGALEHIHVVLVQNLARALAELQQFGIITVGLDANASNCIEDMPWPDRLALVFGAEGKGLRQLTRQTCQQVCRIVGDGRIASLNVSNAVAIALHLAALRRRQRQDSV
jgi:23S rRNA (guanosine2251-2'-O)-methyltransferase